VLSAPWSTSSRRAAEFTTLSGTGLTGMLAVLTVVLATGGYATTRHVTV
jgi:hypothetical protein